MDVPPWAIIRGRGRRLPEGFGSELRVLLAGGEGGRGIQRALALEDRGDPAGLVDHEGGPVRPQGSLHSVSRGGSPALVGQQGKDGVSTKIF